MTRPQSPREELQPYIDFALVEFGWTEERFLHQTPMQWQGVMEAWLNRERRADRRTARICATLANVFGNNVTEDDFMPRIPTDDDAMTIDEMFVALGGDLPNGR